MVKPLRNEITFFGHIIQGNRITIKTDDMEVLAPNEDEIFEITLRRIAQLPAFAEMEMSPFAQSVVDVLAHEAGIKDAQILFLLYCRRWKLESRDLEPRDLTPAFVKDLSESVLALTQDRKLAELVALKLERMSK